jgi:hypothetical protein
MKLFCVFKSFDKKNIEKTESRKRAKEKNDEKLEPNKKTESKKFCQLFRNFPVIKTQNIGNFSKQNNNIIFITKKKKI